MQSDARLSATVRPKNRTAMPESCARNTVVGATSTAKINLIGVTREELNGLLCEHGTELAKARMRVQQIWQWIYQKGVRDFGLMTNLAKDFRNRLAESFEIRVPGMARRQVSNDGTRKYLFRLESGQEIETVYIPDADRGTLCVSSQVGCTLNCSFCHTGTQAWVRNLTAGEIVGQIMAVRDDLGEWPAPGRNPKEETRLLSNIVFMGMGEPLYNFENVRDAIHIARDGSGIGISRKRITLSTAGVVPGIHRAGNEIGCRLAISLHATTDKVRNLLVPINRRWPIGELLESLRTYPLLSNADRITFEYVMLKGVNDSDQDARRLVRLIAGIPAKVNLIPFNAWPGARFERSDPERIEAFSQIVFDAGYASPVRTPRGEDIMAACGQLKSASERLRRTRLSDRVMANP